MKVGIVGWRGMVGSVLLERMVEEGDFEQISVDFFSTSQVGSPSPIGPGLLLDAMDLQRLAEYEVILTCQGGSYTEAVYERLRTSGWNGYWIDAASTLRMREDSLIVLDPVNRPAIEAGLRGGTRCFVGGNCTVSLLLMALQPLIDRGWIRWISSMTYQAVSGAGAAAVLEMLEQTEEQIRGLHRAQEEAPGSLSALQRALVVEQAVASGAVSTEALGAPIASNLLPWIDMPVEGGRSREEWKGHVEANKILGLDTPIMVDGLCVRVPSYRCHSQALTIQLTGPIATSELEAALRSGHEWLHYVKNEPEATLAALTPSAVTGSLGIAVGRLHRLRFSDDMVTLFTVGDQLLWGAAEPLRRMLRILVGSR